MVVGVFFSWAFNLLRTQKIRNPGVWCLLGGWTTALAVGTVILAMDGGYWELRDSICKQADRIMIQSCRHIYNSCDDLDDIRVTCKVLFTWQINLNLLFGRNTKFYEFGSGSRLSVEIIGGSCYFVCHVNFSGSKHRLTLCCKRRALSPGPAPRKKRLQGEAWAWWPIFFFFGAEGAQIALKP